MSGTHFDVAVLFVELLKKHFKNKLISVVLYGSVAQGCEKPSSDIDLLLIIEDLPSGRYERRKILEPVFREWENSTVADRGLFISTILKTPKEAVKLSPIYFDMVDRRKFLVDQKNFFEKILDNVRKRLEKLGAKRKKSGKIEYWDLKPDYVPGEVFEI